MAVFDKRTASVLATILLFIGAGAFLYGVRRVLVVFLLAILFAYLLEPLVSRLQRWHSLSAGSRTLAIAEVYVILGVLLAVLGFLVGPRIIEEGKTLANALPDLFERLSSGQIALQIGSRRGWSYDTQFRVQQYLADHSDTILKSVSSAGAWLARFAENLIWIALIPILAVFFLKDGRAFTQEILETVERRQQKQLLTEILAELHEMLARYIRSQIILTGLSLAAYMGVLSLLRVPYALALGSFAGILEFIPIVGPAAGAAAILGISFLANYHHLIFVALFLLVWRIVQDYVTAPRIMSSGLRLHPLAVIFAVLVGGEIGGVVGIYLSIPVAASLRIVWRRWRRVESADRSNIRAA